MYMCSIPNGFGDRSILLYSSLDLAPNSVLPSHMWIGVKRQLAFVAVYSVGVLWKMPHIFTNAEYADMLSLQQGAHGSVVGWDIMLQAGRSRVPLAMRSLNFSIYLILPAALWPWSQLSLSRNKYQEYSWRVKGGRHVRLTAICEPIF
jgi:hypothetical protein